MTSIGKVLANGDPSQALPTISPEKALGGTFFSGSLVPIAILVVALLVVSLFVFLSVRAIRKKGGGDQGQVPPSPAA